MSTIGNFSGTPNYGGRQPNASAYIKSFVYSTQSFITWVYLTLEGITYITPSISKLPALIQNNLIVTGQIINNGIVITSDKKLKENIYEIDTSKADDILKLNPKEYNYIKDTNKNLHYGLIAQDLEEFFPNLVKTENNTKMVNYIELIPIIISKIKNMQNEIDNLNNEVRLLKKYKLE
jgi:hypothetical protein